MRSGRISGLFQGENAVLQQCKQALENADGIRSDYPRIPLPDSLERLRASAVLGARIADLLDGENPSFPESVKGVGKLARKGGGQLSSAV